MLKMMLILPLLLQVFFTAPARPQAQQCLYSYYYYNNRYGSCWGAHMPASNWDTARQNCLRDGGNLMKVDNAQKVEEIHNLFNPLGIDTSYYNVTEDYFVGGTKVSGSWQWLDSSAVSSSLISCSGSEDCLAVALSGPLLMHCVSCSSSAKYICEIPV